MKVRAPSANSRYFDVKKLIHGQNLLTICEEARCPNISECWGRGTATFQILGDTCTRACRYCYVNSGRPEHPPDPLEPLRLAHTAAQMKLKHVVVTSVDRDDLDDKGAAHYAATIRALKAKVPAASVEVLTPDFLGYEEEALRIVLAERPDVFNHNIETVRRLHRKMRGAKVDYDRALWLLARAKEVADYPVLTKSGIIVGLGETNDEVVETMRDLRAHGVDVVTIGQYLQPSAKHAQIDRWVHPDEFRWFREQGEAMGFGSVFSGPLVRSQLSRRRAAPRRRNRTRRSRVLEGKRAASGGGPLSFSVGLGLVAAAGAVDLGVVDVLLGRVAPDRARVRPHDVRVTVAVGVDPHVVAQEAGLGRVVGRRQVRHRGRRHPRVVVARVIRVRIPDLRGRDVVAAGRLAVAVWRS